MCAGSGARTDDSLGRAFLHEPIAGEQNHRTDNRQDDAADIYTGYAAQTDNPTDKATDDTAGDADQSGNDEAAGIVAGHNMAAYNSAKAAVRHLSKSVALHCAKQGNGIRCNSVHPAFVRTPILDPLVDRFGAEDAYAKLGRQIPLGRIGEPAEVAYGVLYLASDESSFMTGAELVLDGGLSAQ